jgi:hypothetical protein
VNSKALEVMMRIHSKLLVLHGDFTLAEVAAGRFDESCAVP